jgi:predicted GNAT superfamily acetyltransferase
MIYKLVDDWNIRDCRESDLQVLLRLNLESEHWLSPLSLSGLQDLQREAWYCRVKTITCEFDIDPPNDASRRLHAQFGFHEVGTQQVAGGKKTVSLQAAPL